VQSKCEQEKAFLGWCLDTSVFIFSCLSSFYFVILWWSFSLGSFANNIWQTAERCYSLSLSQALFKCNRCTATSVDRSFCSFRW